MVKKKINDIIQVRDRICLIWEMQSFKNTESRKVMMESGQKACKGQEAHYECPYIGISGTDLDF